MDTTGFSLDEVDLLFQLVRARYGDRLTPTELDELRKGVEAVVKSARVLRGVRLSNADEPAQPFGPFRGDS